MARIHMITFGCSLNHADSELMAGLLKAAGHSVTSRDEEPEDGADLVIINSCTVKNMAESKLMHEVRRAEESGKSIVICGCVAQAQPEYRFSKLKDYSILGTKQLNNICHVVDETLAGNTVHLLGQGNNQRFNRPIIRRNRIIGIIPIAEGCLGSCTYCKTRFARGTLHSYAVEDIVGQIRFHLDEGCKEIWLTAQDCGAYGKDIGTDIIGLLQALPKGDYMVRLGMTNPQYVLEFLEGFIDIFRTERRLFRFMHIPVQAGSDRILGLMGRRYSGSDFIRVCHALRTAFPDITIATDVICGFPSETDEEFEETLDLVRAVSPDVLNRSRFWPRPGTPAAVMPGQLHGRDTNRRSRLLEEVFLKVAAQRNSLWIGKECTVIVDERKDKAGLWIGRNKSYRPVGLDGDEILGGSVRVRITGFGDTYLTGSQMR